MKKVLFGTTALAIATLAAGSASAADPIALSLGGKMEQYFGGVGSFDAGNRDDGVGIFTDTEVYFKGSTTLDNGITVAAMIQLEAQTNNTVNADEQYATISGSFGKIQAGQKDGVVDQFAVIAPSVGAVSPSDVVDLWLGYGSADGGNYMNLDHTLGDDDAKLTYITPKFYGFSGGVSFTPTPGGALVPNSEPKNRVQVALGFDNEFSGVGLAASGQFMTQSDDTWVYHTGLNISYAGFTVGGSFTHQLGSDVTEAAVWDAGISYGVGPYSVAFTYADSVADRGLGEQQVFKLGGAYNMGPGIDLVGNVFYGENEAQAGVNNDHRDGLGAVAGLVLAF